MSKARERAYERRRYEEWQTKLSERKQRRRQAQRIVLAVISSLAAIGVIVGVSLVVAGGDDATSTASTTPTPAAATTDAATPAATTAAAAPVKGGCTPSELGPVSDPKKVELAPKSLAAGSSWKLDLATTCGAITIELDGKKAPQAVSSTIALSRAGFYDKTPCHRLTTSGIFVLQCGDPTGSGSGGPGYNYGPLENVPEGGVFEPGDVAMARAQSPDSQGSQFFLVYEKTTLDPAQTGGGYTKIGEITKGLDVVKKVAQAGADDSNGAGDGAPRTPVSILSTKVAKG